MTGLTGLLSLLVTHLGPHWHSWPQVTEQVRPWRVMATLTKSFGMPCARLCCGHHGQREMASSDDDSHCTTTTPSLSVMMTASSPGMRPSMASRTPAIARSLPFSCASLSNRAVQARSSRGSQPQDGRRNEVVERASTYALCLCQTQTDKYELVDFNKLASCGTATLCVPVLGYRLSYTQAPTANLA
jgi:hypothetical protein